MDKPVGVTVVAPQRFAIRRPQAAVMQLDPETDARILEELQQNPDESIDAILSEAKVAKQQVPDQDLLPITPPSRPGRLLDEVEILDGEVSPSSSPTKKPKSPSPHGAQQSIGAGISDPSQFYGQPLAYSTADRGRIPRADGTTHDPSDRKRRVFENSNGQYTKEFLDREIKAKQACMKDPRYYLAFSVAGRTNRRVLDLIEDPLAFAKPVKPEPEEKPSVKDIVTQAITSGQQGLMWLPARYSRKKAIDGFPETYKILYNRRDASPADKKDARVKGLAFKWNKKIRDEDLAPVPDRLPPGSSGQDKIEYAKAMGSIRTSLIPKFKERLSMLQSIPLIQFTNQNLEESLVLQQAIAELESILSEDWVPGAFEDLPGYDLLKGIFEKSDNNMQTTQQAIDAWDDLYNSGLLKRQKLLIQRASVREQTLDRAAAENELFGTPLAPNKVKPSVQKPPVDVRWMSLPEHLGVIFYKEDLTAALDQSLQALSVDCDKGHISEWDLITNPEVQSSFFDLVALHLRINEVMSARRNEQIDKILHPLRRKRMNLLLLFRTLEYVPGAGLIFAANTNILKSAMRHAREAYQSKMMGPSNPSVYQRRIFSSGAGSGAVGAIPRTELAYSKVTEFMDKSRPLTGQEQLEYDKSKALYMSIAGGGGRGY